MPKKSRKDQLRDASQVLQSLFENSKSHLAKGFKTRRLRLEWTSVVGDTLAKICEPVDYDRGTLWIWVQHPTWLQQLSFIREELCKKINNHMQETYVNTVKFTLDRKGLAMSQSRDLDPPDDPARTSPSEDEDL
jgi:predicted nucleic acid-binding Zn ribbon protein